MGMALGLDKGRGESEKDKKIVAVIGDSTFMHMGMQGLLDIVYNKGNVTMMLLDNRAVGMTGGQNNPANGRDIHGEEAPRVDFARLVKALGVKEERVHEVDPYELPTLLKRLRQETKVEEPSVIITNEPCVLVEDYKQAQALHRHRRHLHRLRQLRRRRLPGHPRDHARHASSSPRARRSIAISCGSKARCAPAAACAVQPCAPDAIVCRYG
jgi:indolepyruvate ferredoxin oxidoreductase alpha subunit